MSREHIGPIEKLSDAAAARRRLWVFCRFCGYSRRADPFELAQTIGQDLALDSLAAKLKCTRCTHKYAAILLDVGAMPKR